MLELLRRVAVLIILSAVGIGLLAPVATRSATPVSAVTAQLLSAVERPTSSAPRALFAGRERSARLTLAEVAQPVAAEALAVASAIATPASLSFSAQFAPIPTPRPTPALKQRTRSLAPPPMTGDTISGKATYYCCTRGYRGQAVVALPGALGGHYDAPPAARYVTICADRCARLPVVDSCACYWGTANQKVADLSPEAWAAISDGDRRVMGVVRVTIHLG